MHKTGTKIAYSSILKQIKKYCLLGTVLILLMVCGCKKKFHTIDFKDYDGTILKTILVEEGQVPNYGTSPVREADDDYEYVFKSWDRALKKATEDTEYQAQYEAIEIVETYNDDDSTIIHDINGNEVHLDPALKNKYCTVSFVDDDGTLIQKMRVKYGTIPVYSGDTPVKIDSANIYSFDGWDKDLDVCLKDTTYKATYTKTARTNVGYNASSFDIGTFVKYPEINNNDNSKHSKEQTVDETYYTITVKVLNTAEGTASGGGKYLEGKSVSISALAKVGYEFDKWSDGNTTNPRSIIVTKNEEFYPIFRTVETHSVKVLFNNDSIAQVSKNTLYNVGSTAQISFKLIKSNRYKFLGWDDNGDGFPDGNTDNPRSIIVNDDSSFTPIFEEIPPQPCEITVKVKDSDSDKGSVEGSGTFLEDSVTIIEAIPNPGYHFVQWNDNNTTNPRSIVVSSSTKEYIASFTTNIYKINVSSNNPSFGSVSGSGDYSFGSKVTLKAQANTGYRFYKWSDGNYQNPREEDVLEQKDYTAIFIESIVPEKGDYISFDQHEDTKYLVLNVDKNKVTLLSTTSTAKSKYSESGNVYPNSQLETAIKNEYDLLPSEVKNGVVESSFLNYRYAESNGVSVTNHASVSIYPYAEKDYVCKFFARALSVDDIEKFFGATSDNAGVYNSSDLIKLLNISENDSVWLCSFNEDASKAFYVDYSSEGCSIKSGSLNETDRLIRYIFNIDITKSNYVIDDEKFISTAVPEKVNVNATSSESSWGSVKGSGSYNIGTRVTIKATEFEGCKFVKWDNPEYTEKTFSFAPSSNIDLKAIFYKKVNPQKGDILYFDDSQNQSYIVLDYDENGVATLLSRKAYDSHYNTGSYIDSGIITTCADFYSGLSDSITNKMEKDYSLNIYKYETNDIALHESHVSNAIFPHLDDDIEEVNNVDVYVPGVEDIENFFSTESTKGMASVYSSSYLQKLFDITSDKTILLSSIAGDDECFAIKKVNGLYQIINVSKTTNNCVVYPMFKIKLSSTSDVEFTIKDHLSFSGVIPYRYTITGSVNDSSLGEIEGLNSYTIGSRVTLKAKDKGDGRFLRWGNEEFVTNPVSFIVTDNLNVYAEFYIKRNPHKGDIISFDSLPTKSFIVLNYNDSNHQAVLLSRNDYGTNTVFDAEHKSYAESSVKDRLDDYVNALPADIKAKLVNSEDAAITNQKYSSSANAYVTSSHASRAVIPGFANEGFNYTAFLPGVDDIEKFFATESTNNMASVYSSTNLKELFGETSTKPILLRTEDKINANNSFAVAKGNEEYKIISQSKNTSACVVRPVIIVPLSIDGDLGFKIEKTQSFTQASPKQYQINVTSNDSNLGNVLGTGLYTAGTRVEIKAEPKEGCKFIGWENQEFTDDSYSFVPNDNAAYKAIFYQERNPQKGDILYFDNQKEKTYIVLDYDSENKIATLLSREDYLDNVTYSEDKFANSQLITNLNNFITTLPSEVSNNINKTNITVNKFESKETVIRDTCHASNVVVPSLGAYESVNDLSVYLPSVDDIENFFADESTNGMASAYSSTNLKELFNISSNKPILLGSRDTLNNNYAVVNSNGSYIIKEQAKTTTNCVVRPVFRVKLSVEEEIDYTIKEKQTFSSTIAQKYYVQTISSSEVLGTISNGNKYYTIGTRVTLTATSNGAGKFVSWEPDVSSEATINIIPTSNLVFNAIFYEKRDPNKNEIIFFDIDKNKTFIVLDFDATTKIATILSRDSVTGKVFDNNNKKYSESSLNADCTSYYNNLSTDIKNAIVSSTISINKFENNNVALDSSHASRAVIAGEKVEEINANVYVPDVQDIENVFATSLTTNMASAYSSNNLKELFNIKDSESSILLRSQTEDNAENYAVVKFNNDYQIKTQAKNTTNSSVRYMFKVDLSKVEFTIKGLTTYSLTNPKIYNISTSVNNATYGSVSAGGSYTVGTRINIIPTANEGYEFAQWNDETYNDPRTIIVSKDENIVAQFAEDRFPVKGEIIRFNENDYHSSFTVLETNGDYAVLLDRSNNSTSKHSSSSGSFILSNAVENGYINNLNNTIKSKTQSFGYHRYYYDCYDDALGYKHASKAALPKSNISGASGNGIGSIPDIMIIEKFFGGDESLPGAFDSDSLKKMYNLKPNDRVWLSSIDGTDSSKAFYVNCDELGQCSIISGSKADLSCLVRPIMKVDLSSLNFVITDKINTEQEPSTYTVSVASNNPVFGTVEGGGTYRLGQKFTIKASPKAGYILDKWLLNNNNMGSEHELTKVACLNNSGTYNAIFTQPIYQINVKLPDSLSEFEDITFSGGGQYYAGTEITIKAIFDENKYIFKGWDDDGDGSEDVYEVERTITVNGENTYYAYFKLKEYEIKTSIQYVNGKNPGKVTKEPNDSGIKYHYLDEVKITATPYPGYKFVKWNDGNTNNVRTEIVTANKNYVAIFEPYHYTIHVEVDANSVGKGTVMCSPDAYYGTEFNIVARATEGYEFDYWSVSTSQDYKNYKSSAGILPDSTWENNAVITYTAHFKVEEEFLKPGDVIILTNQQEGCQKYMVFKVESGKVVTLYNLDNTIKSFYTKGSSNYFDNNLDKACNETFYNKLTDRIKNNIEDSDVRVYAVDQDPSYGKYDKTIKEPSDGSSVKRKVYAAGFDDMVDFLGLSTIIDLGNSPFANFIYMGNFDEDNVESRSILLLRDRTKSSSTRHWYILKNEFITKGDYEGTFRPIYKLNMSSFVKDTDYQILEDERYDAATQESYYISCLTEPAGYGIVNYYIDPFFVKEGSSYTADAIPNTNYLFDHWSVQYSDGTSENFQDDPHTFENIQRDMIITAHFKEDPSKFTYDVIGESENEDYGTVSGSAKKVSKNTSVKLTAVAKSGYRFKKWDDNSIENPRTISVSEDVTYTALFEKLPANKTVITINGALYRVLDIEDEKYKVMRLTKVDTSTSFGEVQTIKGSNNRYLVNFFSGEGSLFTKVNDWVNADEQKNIKNALVNNTSVTLYGYSKNSAAQDAKKYWYKDNILETDISTSSNNEYYLTENSTYESTNISASRLAYVIDLKEINSYFDNEMSPQDLIEFFTGKRFAVDEKIWLRSSISDDKVAPLLYVDCNSGRIMASNGSDVCTFRPMFVIDLKNHPEVSYSINSVAPERYTVSVSSSNAVEGVVYGGGKFPKNSNTSVMAKPNPGYVFSHWDNGSTLNPLVINNITGDVSYTASFEKLEGVAKGDLITLGQGNINNKYLVLENENNIATLMCVNYANTSNLSIQYRENTDEADTLYSGLRADVLCDKFYESLSTPVKNAINAVQEDNIKLDIRSYYEDEKALNIEHHASKASYCKPGYTSNDESLDHLVYIPSVNDIEKFFDADNINAGAFSKDDLDAFFGVSSGKVLLRDYARELEDYYSVSKVFVYDSEKHYIDSISSTSSVNTTICPIIRIKLNSDGIIYSVDKHLSFNTTPLSHNVSLQAKYKKDGSFVPAEYIKFSGQGTYNHGSFITIVMLNTGVNYADTIFRGWDGIEGNNESTSVTVSSDITYTALFDKLPQKGTYISLTNAPDNKKNYIVLRSNSGLFNNDVYLLNRDYNATSTYVGDNEKYSGSSLQTAVNDFVNGFDQKYLDALKKVSVTINSVDIMGTKESIRAFKYGTSFPDSTKKEVIQSNSYILSLSEIENFFNISTKGVAYNSDDIKALFGLDDNKSVWLSDIVSTINDTPVDNKRLGYDGDAKLITDIDNNKELLVRPVIVLNFNDEFDYEETGTFTYSAIKNHIISIKLVNEQSQPIESDNYIVSEQVYQPEGSKVTLEVTPKEGYRFIKWSDGNVDNPREVFVGSEDREYKAVVGAYTQLNKGQVITLNSENEGHKSYVVLGDDNGKVTLMNRDNKDKCKIANLNEKCSSFVSAFTSAQNKKSLTKISTVNIYNYDVDASVCDLYSYAAEIIYPGYSNGTLSDVYAYAPSINDIQEFFSATENAPGAFSQDDLKALFGTTEPIHLNNGAYYLESRLKGNCDANVEYYVRPIIVMDFAKRSIDYTSNNVISSSTVHKKHSITLNASDDSFGTVNGSGTDYLRGSKVTISATANPQKKFVKWSDGDTFNPRNIVINNDYTLTAIFADDSTSYKLTVLSNNDQYGSVSGGGTFNNIQEGVEIKATAKPGYKFIKWEDDYYEDTRRVDVYFKEVQYKAIFEPLPQKHDIITLTYVENGEHKTLGNNNSKYYIVDIDNNGVATVLNRDSDILTSYLTNNSYNKYDGSSLDNACTTFYNSLPELIQNAISPSEIVTYQYGTYTYADDEYERVIKAKLDTKQTFGDTIERKVYALDIDDLVKILNSFSSSGASLCTVSDIKKLLNISNNQSIWFRSHVIQEGIDLFYWSYSYNTESVSSITYNASNSLRPMLKIDLSNKNIRFEKTDTYVPSYYSGPDLSKGDIITLNDGKDYRILSLSGTKAKVMAMYDDLTSKYSNDGAKTTFTNDKGETFEGCKYKDSTIDTFMNTWYSNLNNNDVTKPMYNAILPTNVTQKMYLWSDGPGTASDFQDGSITYKYMWKNSDYDNLIYYGLAEVGQRYVYELGIEDVYDYFGKNIVTSNESNEFFLNIPSYEPGKIVKHILLNSVKPDNTAVFAYGTEYTTFTSTSCTNNYIVRPTFVIDLAGDGVTYSKSVSIDLVKGDFITINGEDQEHNDYMVFNVDNTKVYLLAKDHIHMDYIDKNGYSMTNDEINNQLNTYKQGLSINLQDLISSAEFTTYKYALLGYLAKDNATVLSSINKDIDTISYYELQDILGVSDDNLPNTNAIFNIPLIDKNDANVYNVTTRDHEPHYNKNIVLFYYGLLNSSVGNNTFNHTHACPVFWIDLSKDTDNTFSYVKNGNYFDNKETKHTVTFKDGDTTLETKEFVVGELIASSTTPTKEGYEFDGWDYSSDFVPNEDITVNAIWKQTQLPQKGSIIKLNDNKEYRVLSIDGSKAKVMALYDAATKKYYQNGAASRTTTFKKGDNSFTGLKYDGSDIDKYLEQEWYAGLNTGATKPMYDAIQESTVTQNAYKLNTLTHSSITDFDNDAITYKCQTTGIDKYTNYTYYGSADSIVRHVYTLDLKDLYDYYNSKVISNYETNSLFGKDISNKEYQFKLISGSDDDTYSFNVYASGTGHDIYYGRIGTLYYTQESTIRSVFTIDLTASGVTFSIPYHEIRFDTGGGSFVQPISQEAGSSINIPTNPTKEGFIFEGWDTPIPDKMPESDLVIKAKWKMNNGIVKGSIIKLNDNKEYRVLSIDGTKAKVMAMYDNNKSIYSDGTKTTFTKDDGGTFEGVKYEGSTLDTALNQCYSDLNAGNTVSMYKAIQKTNISQCVYDHTTYKPSSGDYYTLGSDYYRYIGSVPVGDRYVYALGLEDLVSYYDNSSLSKDMLSMFFTNKIASYSAEIWLNSASGSDWLCFYDCYGRRLGARLPGMLHYIRPTFTIDLAASGVTVTKPYPEIIFDTGGGCFVQPISQVKDTDITTFKPADPIREGCIFEGWDTEIPDKMPESDLVIKAKWLSKGDYITINGEDNEHNDYMVLKIDGSKVYLLSKDHIHIEYVTKIDSYMSDTDISNQLNSYKEGLSTNLKNLISNENYNTYNYSNSNYTKNTATFSSANKDINTISFYELQEFLDLQDKNITIDIDSIFNIPSSNKTNEMHTITTRDEDKSSNNPIVLYSYGVQSYANSLLRPHTHVCPVFWIDLSKDTSKSFSYEKIGNFFENKGTTNLVTFENNGIFIESKSMLVGSTIATTAIPKKEGCVFDGWDYISDFVPNKDITVNAKFKELARKGSIIKLNDGKEYRVLSIDGTKAKVMAMYNDLSSKYSDGATTTFTDKSGGTCTGLEYKSSALDNYLNNWYDNLGNNDTTKPMHDAIQKTNIIQNIYQDNATKPSSSIEFYSSQYNWSTIAGYLVNKGSISVGERYVYALGVEDIFEYVESDFISSNSLNSMFFNQTTIISKFILLNSGVSNYADYPRAVRGDIGTIDCGYKYNNTSVARPTFTIDLAASGVTVTKPYPEIIFDTGGGSFVQPISQVKDTNITTYKPADPIREGFIFEGWDTEIPDKMPESDLVIKAKWKKDENYVAKGFIIKLSDGKEYRVLSLDGSKAKVMAMYDEIKPDFGDYSTKAIFTDQANTAEGIKYDGSPIDSCLTDWYNGLNNNNDTKKMHDAIISTNVVQKHYSSENEPDSATDFDNGAITYKYQYDAHDDDYENLIYKGSTSAIQRYVYELGFEDIYDYFGKNIITSNEINEFFFDIPLYESGAINKYIWLNSSSDFTDNYESIPRFNNYQANSSYFSNSRPKEIAGNPGIYVRPTFVIDVSKEGVLYKEPTYSPVKGDLISISGEDEKYNDYVVLGVDGNNVKLALRDEMPSFLPKDVEISDTTDRDKFMNYIDTECAEFKGNLSQALQSSMVETDYYSIRIKTCGNWSIGNTDDSQKKQYTNKFVCTLSVQDVIDYMGTKTPSDALIAKYVSTFFLTDESSDIVGRDSFSVQTSILRFRSTGSLYANNKVRLCPVFTIDLTKLSSNIFLKGNALND